MNGKEIEAKFLFVDFVELRKQLQKQNARCNFEMRDYRRIIFDYPDLRFQKGSESIRFRVRDEGDKVALNFKQRLGDDKYDDEIEVVVDLIVFL